MYAAVDFVFCEASMIDWNVTTIDAPVPISALLRLAEPVADRPEAALVALLGLLVALLVALQSVADRAQRLVELLGVLVPPAHERLEAGERLALPDSGQRLELRAELAEAALDLLVDVVHLL